MISLVVLLEEKEALACDSHLVVVVVVIKRDLAALDRAFLEDFLHLVEEVVMVEDIAAFLETDDDALKIFFG